MPLVNALLLVGARSGSAAPLGEAWVELGPGDPARLSEVPGVGLGERRDGARVQVLVEPGGVEALRAAGLRVVSSRADHRLAAPLAGFHGPEDGTAHLEDLAARSDRAGLARFGTSVEGRPIVALWIGQPPGSGAPSLRILGAHHGDEPASAEVALGLAEVLADGDDPRVEAVLSRSTVWIVPYVNPDGVADGSRVNARGVDLNRNYDFEWRADTLRPGDGPFSEPETRALRAAAALERPIASVSLHGGAANIGWPWNFTRDDPPDAQTLAQLAEVYAQACDAPGFWTTQGADWYPSWGDLNDWSYGRYGGLDFTVEVATWVEPDDLAEVVDWHVEALLALLSVPPTVSGVVVDAVSGVPIEATLSPGHGAPFPSDPATGAFARFLPAGVAAVRMTVEAPGYEGAEIEVGGAPVAIALEPTSLVSGRPDPVVLWEPAVVDLGAEGAGAPVQLVRPGADPVEVAPGDLLDPEALAPGAWTLIRADGGVIPRALIVEQRAGAAVERWSTEGGVVRIVGSGFGEGARAWALADLERAPVEVPVRYADSALEIDESTLPSVDPVDLVLWTNGSILGVPDARAPGSRPGADERLLPVGACACAPPPGHKWQSLLSILAAVAATAARRPRS